MAQRGKASKGKRHQPQNTAATVQTLKSKPKRFITWGLGVVTVAALAGSIVVANIGGREGKLSFDSPSTSQTRVIPANYSHSYTTEGPRTLQELLALSNDELEKLDIALINLLCAEGLPGSEGLDIEGTLATLDRWAEHAKQEAEAHFYKHLRDPDDWGTESRWRMASLATALQLDCGVHYNLERVTDIDFTQSQDLFIHGMVKPGLRPVRTIDDPEGAKKLRDSMTGGTCTSMPVLYAAVARRLGYPVTISTTQSHVFCRWDGEGHENPNYHDYFNVDATGRGVQIYDDAYYLTWPKKITQEYADKHGFFESQNNATALAGFMAARGHCLLDTGHTKEAYEAYTHAVRLSPDTPHFQEFLADADKKVKIEEYQAKIEHQRYLQRVQKQHDAFVRQVEADNRRRMQELMRRHNPNAQPRQRQSPYPGYVDPHQGWPAQPQHYPYTHDPFAPPQPPGY